MFRWIKTSGCDCCPVADGCERYLLNVGDLFGGRVESHKSPHTGELSWEYMYSVCGKEYSGGSGGGTTRDSGMKYVEDKILDSITKLRWVHANPERKIFSALVEKDPVTGEYSQKELS